MTSVVVPAHNEAAVIGRCLAPFAAAGADEFDVVVVCNGCTDDTAERARAVDGVTVVEIAAASKIAALNAGDDAAKGFPRLYLDADVVTDLASLRSVAQALRAGAPSAAPVPVVDSSRCGRLSRAYFAIWSRLGYATRSVVGSGCYGLSEAGRARFDRFPDIIADDALVYRLFDPGERVNPPGARLTIRPPRTVGALVRRRVRIDLGNVQLDRLGFPRPQVPAPGWRAVVQAAPRLAPAALVYLGVNAIAKGRGRALLRAGGGWSWNQDRTSRAA